MPESVEQPELVERLDRLLPQTQCGQCGFDGCRPYAEAMARGEAGIDRCHPAVTQVFAGWRRYSTCLRSLTTAHVATTSHHRSR